MTRDDLHRAMIEAHHTAIGHPDPLLCTCDAPEITGNAINAVVDFVAAWLMSLGTLARGDLVERWREDMDDVGRDAD